MTMHTSRRFILSAIGIALPFGLGARAGASPARPGTPVELRFRPFEESLRDAFEGRNRAHPDDIACEGRTIPCRRLEVGHSDLVRSGVQGCHNDRPFAGFPAGALRVVRSSSEPGPVWRGVRLYVSTIDVALTDGTTPGDEGRPLDFASLPPAPILG